MQPNRKVFPLFEAQHSAELSLWSVADDRVMGGESIAQLERQAQGHDSCVCLSGRVSLARGGGFVQMRWPLKSHGVQAEHCIGIYLEARGNGETYGVHLRTRQLFLPWQSFRSSFVASDEWTTLFLPFAAFEPYRTQAKLDIHALVKIGIVAIGRAFDAEVCVRKMGFYQEDSAQ